MVIQNFDILDFRFWNNTIPYRAVIRHKTRASVHSTVAP
jgi:hypothetical protein